MPQPHTVSSGTSVLAARPAIVPRKCDLSPTYPALPRSYSSISGTPASSSEGPNNAKGVHVGMSENASSLPSQEYPAAASAAAENKVSTRFPSHGERRHRRRAPIAALMRVRGLNITDSECPDEISTTVDVSRNGLLFLSHNSSYKPGMELAITFPYSNAPTAIHAEQGGRVVRIAEMSDGLRAVAISLAKRAGADAETQIVDVAGRQIANAYTALVAPATSSEQAGPRRPLILVVDADDSIRETLKTYFVAGGYEVIAVNNAADAREVLNMMTPVLIIAEVEGDGLPGLDLCVHVKSTVRLRHVPVILTTSSAYPSDYANAHSLGAVVCMAKPYKQERMGHVVRLLAPTEQAKQQPAPRSAACVQASSSKSAAPDDSHQQRRWRLRFS